MSAAPPAVHAIVVTHNPRPHAVQAVLAALAPQVSGTILVDNHSSNAALDWLAEPPLAVTVLRNDTNRGLGAALNQGADRAIDAGATHLLFLDQDSLPDRDMVRRLLDRLQAQPQAQNGPSIAAVGPEWTDHRRGRHVPASDGSVEETDFLITSGMLVPVEAYRAVGRFDEGLFIDSTDREWCFRAVHRGHRLLRISGALLSHELGDSLFSVMALPGLEFARHRPERLYYMMRNRTLLYGRRYVPASWKIKDAMRATGKFVLFSFFVSPRFSSAQFMLKGIIDGLRGKTGPRQR